MHTERHEVYSQNDMKDSDVFAATAYPDPSSAAKKSDVSRRARVTDADDLLSRSDGGDLDHRRRPSFYLRSTFHDAFRAFPSLKGMPFMYRGRAHRNTNEYFFVDVFDTRHQRFIPHTAAREEVFSDTPIGGER